MTEKRRKSHTNSVQARARAFEGSDRVVDPPDGVEWTTDEERTLWRQFTRARGRDDWSELDLVMVARAVRLEIKIRETEQELAATGTIVTNARGTQIPNPLIGIIDGYVRQQLAISRSMNLMSSPGHPGTMRKNAQLEKEARTVKSQADDNVSLFASRSAKT